MTGAPVDWPTHNLVTHRVRATPERTAVVDMETNDRWSFREFDRRVDDAARGIRRALGNPQNDRLGVLMDTRPAFATVFFAAMRLGATVVPLNVRETTGELAAKVDRTGLEAIVCEAGTESSALELADEAALEGECVWSVDDPEIERVRALYSDRRETESEFEGDRTVEPVSLGRDETQLIMFTSGTSGEPKGVRLTVGNLVASATASAFRLGVDPDDRWLCCLPMYHMGGLAPVVRSVLYGTTVVIQRAFEPRETARILERENATGVSLVPTMCKRLLDAGWQPAEALRFVLLGGAPASSELLERCHAANVPVHPTYGMTETASQIATATPAETRTQEGTVGQPLLFADVTVVDDDGEGVPIGEPGELVVSGPTVTPGYLEPERTDAAFGGRGLYTGDVGYADEDGRLWVLNRRSDRIVTGGENVDPGEVVAVLRSHPGVADAAVVGLEDREWGERVGALVVPEGADGPAGGRSETAAESLALESVLGHCDDRLAGFKRPKMIAVVASLPRTPSGTVDREATRTRLLESGIDVSDWSRSS
ncbi:MULTISPECIES: class I adenylate-forming enzyme family protein [Natrialbaceae]|uniref:class I adenylate-forming enzyme family protein n=1 Tax=Natrialbaceae TaxID=1644061 RepID=UPI00207D3EB2|nr:class I adenylate-forming enzyme family protein [Natronococcus sp. CG52]